MLTSWKFAANAVWEEALSIDANQPIDLLAVEQWVISNPQNVALEAIFSDSDNLTTMFGIRVTCLSKSDQVSRIRNLLAHSDTLVTEADFKNAAVKIFPEFILFSARLEAVNIGIVSQWYSFGPQTIWTHDSTSPFSSEELEKKAPKFFVPTANPAAVEFWYTKPTDHWYKIYVSDRHTDGYLLNKAKYDYALSRLAEFK
jgi:hypothetical protein